jgi:hypothetical protein
MRAGGLHQHCGRRCGKGGKGAVEPLVCPSLIEGGEEMVFDGRGREDQSDEIRGKISN